MRFTIDANVFVRLLSSVELAVSRDETREHINSLLLDFTPGEQVLVATDGHRMAVYEVKPIAKENAPGDYTVTDATGSARALIPLCDVQRIVKAIGKPKKNDPPRECHVSIEAKSINVAIVDAFNRRDTIEARVTDAQFPPWRQVMPAKDRKVGGMVALNGAYMAEVHKSFALAFPESRTQGVVVEPGAPLDPVRFTGDDETCPLTWIVMPMRSRRTDVVRAKSPAADRAALREFMGDTKPVPAPAEPVAVNVEPVRALAPVIDLAAHRAFKAAVIEAERVTFPDAPEIDAQAARLAEAEAERIALGFASDALGE